MNKSLKVGKTYCLLMLMAGLTLFSMASTPTQCPIIIGPPPTPTPTPSGGNSDLDISQNSVVLSCPNFQATIFVTNIGNETLNWDTNPAGLGALGIELIPATGQVEPGGRQDLTVRVQNPEHPFFGSGSFIVGNTGVNGDFVTISVEVTEECPGEGEGELPEGEVELPEGEVELPEGEVELPEGEVEIGEGEVEIGEGEVEIGEGEVEIGEGEVEIGEGEVEIGEGEVEIGEGEIEVPEAEVGEGEIELPEEIVVGEGEREVAEGEGEIPAEGEIELPPGEGELPTEEFPAEGEFEPPPGQFLGYSLTLFTTQASGLQQGNETEPNDSPDAPGVITTVFTSVTQPASQFLGSLNTASDLLDLYTVLIDIGAGGEGEPLPGEGEPLPGEGEAEVPILKGKLAPSAEGEGEVPVEAIEESVPSEPTPPPGEGEGEIIPGEGEGPGVGQVFASIVAFDSDIVATLRDANTSEVIDQRLVAVGQEEVIQLPPIGPFFVVLEVPQSGEGEGEFEVPAEVESDFVEEGTAAQQYQLALFPSQPSSTQQGNETEPNDSADAPGVITSNFSSATDPAFVFSGSLLSDPTDGVDVYGVTCSFPPEVVEPQVLAQVNPLDADVVVLLLDSNLQPIDQRFIVAGGEDSIAIPPQGTFFIAIMVSSPGGEGEIIPGEGEILPGEGEIPVEPEPLPETEFGFGEF